MLSVLALPVVPVVTRASMLGLTFDVLSRTVAGTSLGLTSARSDRVLAPM